MPYEWEWQQAATSGFASRTFPWSGDECNTDDANIVDFVGRTTAVGLYARGKSDQGVYDLSGNVWEWCANTYEEPENIHEQQGDELRTIRGGAWSDPASFARAADRFGYRPGHRYYFVVFRVVCAPPSSSTDH